MLLQPCPVAMLAAHLEVVFMFVNLNVWDLNSSWLPILIPFFQSPVIDSENRDEITYLASWLFPLSSVKLCLSMRFIAVLFMDETLLLSFIFTI